MQLKNSNNGRLAIAAAGLLGAANVTSVSAAEWTNEFSALYYGESDDRVTDLSLTYQAVRTKEDESSLSLNLAIDSLTGASPSGVTPSNEVQTVTSPSGRKQITFPAGSQQLDESFKDTRVSASAGWTSAPINDKTRLNFGGSFSTEYDYLHLGLNGGFSHEFNNKNSTLSAGFAYAADTIEAVGNAPIPLSPDGSAKGEKSEDKNTVDLLLGLTQIASKNTIMQFNYGFTQADGYQNDPYKWVSRVDSNGKIIQNLHEARPDSRTSNSLYAAVKHALPSSNVLSASFRYYSDDWGIDSYTLDGKFLVGLGNNNSIEPHIRYYHQSAADFYVAQLDAAASVPSYATADYRLAEFDAITVGASYRWGTRYKWRVTGEFYSQNPTEVSLTAGQAGLNANPGFSAVMLSFGLKF